MYVGRDYYLAPVRLALWDAATGALLGYSEQFGVTQYNPLKYEMDIAPVTVAAGQQLLVGCWWPADGDHQARYGWASGGTWYAKSIGGIGSMSGASAQNNAHVGAFAYFTETPPPPPPPPTLGTLTIDTSAAPGSVTFHWQNPVGARIKVHMHWPPSQPPSCPGGPYVVAAVDATSLTVDLSGLASSGVWQVQAFAVGSDGQPLASSTVAAMTL
jgi:hypothetical protein